MQMQYINQFYFSEIFFRRSEASQPLMQAQTTANPRKNTLLHGDILRVQNHTEPAAHQISIIFRMLQPYIKNPRMSNSLDIQLRINHIQLKIRH